jgi:HlyD family secretion protein
MAVETVLLAESDLRTATDALAETRSPDAGTVAAGRAGLEVARARLADVITDLDDLRSVGTDQQLIALREAETQAATAALADTQALFVAATIRAPAAGVIDAVHVEVGDELGRNETVIELLDPSTVTVVMDVDQVDILSVFVGAQTSVTVDALPGQTLPGLISEIGPASLAQGGAVSFPVTVQVNLPAGIELLEGLSATAQVLSDVVRNVLMVPAVAVGGTFSSPTVNVLNGGSVETVQISLGGGNETFAIIASGVVEGDIVVFTLPDTNQQTNPFAVFREGFGGGRGFGGGGGGGGFGGGGGGGGGARGFDDHN